MNLFAPVSSLMTDHKRLITVDPEESLARVKELFDTHTFHHLPVVHFREIVGMVSKSDIDHFLAGAARNAKGNFSPDAVLAEAQVQEIMTKRLGKVSSDDRLNVVVEIFKINLFHALPVVDEGELVGLITPFDIIRALADERPADPSMVYENQSSTK